VCGRLVELRGVAKRSEFFHAYQDTTREPSVGPAAENLWYKDAVIYQLHVRTFCDSNGDGIGDFRGLTLKARLLCRSWALTRFGSCLFYPSPLRDDGYDIRGLHFGTSELRIARGL